jgi:hypothetical protein
VVTQVLESHRIVTIGNACTCEAVAVCPEVLTLSLAVAVQDTPLFVKFASAFTETCISFADMMLESITDKPKQRKSHLISYWSLLS